MINDLQAFVASLPVFTAVLGVLAVSAIPFVESYLGSAIGILAGIHPLVAVPAAIVGNIVSMLVFVRVTQGARARALRDRETPQMSPRRTKLRNAFDRYGVAGVSLLGQTILPSQITSAALVSFGATPRLVVLWQVVSIILWGVVFGLLATLGVDVLTT